MLKKVKINSKIVKTCAVAGCTTKLSSHPLSRRTFNFPKDPEIRKKWIDACGDPQLDPNNSKVCSLHFEGQDYRMQDRLLNVPHRKRKLICTAVPKNILKKQDEKLLLNTDCNYYDVHTGADADTNTVKSFDFELTGENSELKTGRIEFIDISTSPSYKIIENNECTKFYKDSGVQCNLYEELWNQRKLNNPTDCTCIDMFFETLESTKKNKIVEPIRDSTEIELNINEISNNIDDKLNSNIIPEINSYSYANTKTKSIKNQIHRENNYIKLSNDSGYQCKICNKICLNLAAYCAHSRIHLERSSVCSTCGLNLVNYKMAAKHEIYCSNKIRSSIGKEKRKFKNVNKTCGICNRTFDKSVTYMDHLNIHYNSKPYICSCLTKFTHYSNFLNHVIKFKCPVEGRIIPNYAPQGQSSEYIEMKEKGLLPKTKRYKCRICNISYARDRYLQHFDEDKHLEAEKIWLKKFNINKKFSCSHCNDHVFDRLSNCISHRSKIHRRFPTDEFLKTFEIESEKNECDNLTDIIQDNKNNLIPNLENRLKRSNKLSSKEKYCSECNKYFVKRITFLDHMNIHRKTYPYICACGARKRFYQCFLTHIRRNQCKGKHIFPDYAPQTFAISNREIEKKN